MWDIDTHIHTTEYCPAIKKKNKILSFAATLMSWKVLFLAKWEIERQIVYVFTYMRNLKNTTNNIINKKNRFIDTENKLVVTV